MPVDIRHELNRAAGPTAKRPDVAAAMHRGEHLRRQRRLAVSTTAAATVATVVGVALLLGPSDTQQLPPVDERPPPGSIEQLDVFERPATREDRITDMTYQMGTLDDPGIQRRTPRLDPPAPPPGPEALADGDAYPLDVDRLAARLAWQDDEVTVHLAPPTGEPVDPDLEPLDGDWVYVLLDRPGTHFTGSAPVPAAGTATWAGSVNLHGLQTAIVVVGDGLDQARGPSGSVAVQSNVVLVDDVERGDHIILTGPAGTYTLTIPPDDADAS